MRSRTLLLERVSRTAWPRAFRPFGLPALLVVHGPALGEVPDHLVVGNFFRSFSVGLQLCKARNFCVVVDLLLCTLCCISVMACLHMPPRLLVRFARLLCLPLLTPFLIPERRDPRLTAENILFRF